MNSDFGGGAGIVSHKRSKIEQLLARVTTSDVDPHYAAYFDCFNQELFFEAHEVLEPLWLADRTGPAGAFYKGLIQLAGAFVHLQKNRLQPAASLFRLAHRNLQNYAPAFQRLEISSLLENICYWIGQLEHAESNPLDRIAAPKLALEAC